MAFPITLLVGAAAMLALGRWLGRRVKPDADWRRVLAIGVASAVIGIAGAAYGALAQDPAPVADAPANNLIAASAVTLISVALVWFGGLLCGVAWSYALRPPLPAAPAPDPEATLREPTLGPPPNP
jgi:hypothetical protein